MPTEVFRTTEAGKPKRVGNGLIYAQSNYLAISFSEPRGFGRSEFSTVVRPDQFVYVARAMMRSNPKEPIKAFGEALKRGVQEPLDPTLQWCPEREDRKATRANS